MRCRLELISSLGSYLSGISMLVFVYVVVRTFTTRVQLATIIGGGATTLEWTQTSPPATTPI